MILQNSNSKLNGRTRSFSRKRKPSPNKKKTVSVPKITMKTPVQNLVNSILNRSSHIVIGDALVRKYSSTQNRYYLSLVNKLVDKEEVNSQNIMLADLRDFIKQSGHLKKYYKPNPRYQAMRQAVAKYELHKQIPRLFIQQVSEIIKKCHHNRRLLDYVRLAKILGLTVDNQQLLTFMRSFQMSMTKRSYSKVLGEISSYNFSGQESQENPEMMMINSIQRLIQPFTFYDKEQKHQPLQDCFMKKGVNLQAKIPSSYQSNYGQNTRRHYV